MSRTIEAIMRHMTLPSNRGHQSTEWNREAAKGIHCKKAVAVHAGRKRIRAHTMAPFHSNVRVGYNGKEVDGKNVLNLMTLAPPEGSTVRVIAEGPDAAEAMHALEQLMQSQPGENRISTLSEQIWSFTSAHDRSDRQREGANI